MIMPTARDEGRGLAGGWKRGHPGRGVLTSDAEQPWHREQAGGTPAAGQSRKMLYQLSPERQGVCTCVCVCVLTHTHAHARSSPVAPVPHTVPPATTARGGHRALAHRVLLSPSPRPLRGPGLRGNSVTFGMV